MNNNVDRVFKQIQNRNLREKINVPEFKRSVFKRVHETLYKTNFAPILLGLRRVGKTTIFRQILKEDERAVIIPFEDISLRALNDIEFTELISDFYYKENKRIFLIDEAQSILDWDKKVFSLINSFPDAKFAITGSSSLNLTNRETGLDRTMVINISTLTFNEYLEFSGKIGNKKELFEEFLGTGGFPGHIHNNDDFMTKIYTLKETILKDLIDNDITRTYNDIKPHLLNELIIRLSRLTNGELNKSKIISGMDRFTQRELDHYINVLEKARLIHVVNKINENGQKNKRNKQKVFLNPHVHIWLLETKFQNIDSKFKGHIIESYWLTWVDSVNQHGKKHYYLKDNKTNQEIDFVSLDQEGKFKTLHEFKYSHSIHLNNLFNKLPAKNKVVWCLEDKVKDGIKYISLPDISDTEGKKH